MIGMKDTWRPTIGWSRLQQFRTTEAQSCSSTVLRCTHLWESKDISKHGPRNPIVTFTDHDPDGMIFEMSKFKFEYLVHYALAEASVVIAIHEESKQGNFQWAMSHQARSIKYQVPISMLFWRASLHEGHFTVSESLGPDPVHQLYFLVKR